MNKSQAVALLELIADLYLLANEPDHDHGPAAETNGHVQIDADELAKL